MCITSLTTLTLVGILSATPPRATAAGNDETLTATPRLAHVLNAAQAAIKGRHWHQADVLLNSAKALDLNAHGQYLLDELRAYVFYQEDKPAEAAAAYGRLLHSPESAGAHSAWRTKTIAELYFRATNYREAVKYGGEYLRLHPDDSNIGALLAESYLRLGNYRRSAGTMTTVVERTEARHEVPRESWLRIAQNAYFSMGDVDDARLMLQKLVRYYHHPEDWSSLLTVSSRESNDAHLEFGFLRLRSELGLLSDPSQYEALMFEFLEAGMPARANALLRQAKERRVFSVDRAERLQHALEVQGSNLQRRLDHTINRAQRDPTGESDAAAGRAYLGESHYAEAIQAFQRGLQKGGLRNPDEIRVDLGIALLRNHQPGLSHSVFDQVSAKSGWATLANLWSLRLEDSSSGIQS